MNSTGLRTSYEGVKETKTQRQYVTSRSTKSSVILWEHIQGDVDEEENVIWKCNFVRGSEDTRGEGRTENIVFPSNFARTYYANFLTLPEINDYLQSIWQQHSLTTPCLAYEASISVPFSIKEWLEGGIFNIGPCKNWVVGKGGGGGETSRERSEGMLSENLVLISPVPISISSEKTVKNP